MKYICNTILTNNLQKGKINMFDISITVYFLLIILV